MITLRSLLATIKMEIPETDRMSFNNLDRYILENARKFVETNLPEKYNECIIKPIEINNGRGQLPRDIDCVQMAVGSSDPDVYEKTGWREEIVGMLHKSTSRGSTCDKGCTSDCDHKKKGSVTYGVYAQCECGEPDCCHPIVVAAKEANHMLAEGGSYFMTKHSYGVIKDKKGLKSPHFKDYFLMCPTNASFHGYGSSNHIDNCTGFNCRELIGREWDYKMFDGEIRTNFKRGKVLLSYTGKVYDEHGIVKIPRVQEFINAVESFVLMKAYFMLWKSKKSGIYERLYTKHEVLYEKMLQDSEGKLMELDLNHISSILMKYKNNWNNFDNTKIGMLTQDGTSWATVFENSLTDY